MHLWLKILFVLNFCVAYAHEDLSLQQIENNLTNVTSSAEVPRLLWQRIEILESQVTGVDRNLDRLLNALSATHDFEHQAQLWKKISAAEKIESGILNFEEYSKRIHDSKLKIEDLLAQKYFLKINALEKKSRNSGDYKRLIANEFPESTICLEKIINCELYKVVGWNSSISLLPLSLSYFGSQNYTQLLLIKLAVEEKRWDVAGKHLPFVVFDTTSPAFSVGVQLLTENQEFLCPKHSEAVSPLCQKQKSKNGDSMKARIHGLLQAKLTSQAVQEFNRFVCRAVTGEAEDCSVNGKMDISVILRLANNIEYQELESELLSYYDENHSDVYFVQMFLILEMMYEETLKSPVGNRARKVLPTWLQANHYLVSYHFWNEKNPVRAREFFEANHLGINPEIPNHWYFKSRELLHLK